jgi:hypothetical protein
MPSTIVESSTHHLIDPQSYPGNGIPTGSYGYGTDFNYNDPGLGHATHSQAQASFPPGFDASAFDATASQFPDYNQNGVSPLSDYALPAQLPSDLTSTAAPAYAGSSFSSVDNMPGRSNAH